jgi:hypothetical protein
MPGQTPPPLVIRTVACSDTEGYKFGQSCGHAAPNEPQIILRTVMAYQDHMRQGPEDDIGNAVGRCGHLKLKIQCSKVDKETH